MSNKSILFQVLKKHPEFSQPVYSTISIGKDNNPSFASTVLFDNITFVQEGYSTRLKLSQDVVSAQVLAHLYSRYQISGDFSYSSIFNVEYQKFYRISPKFVNEHVEDTYTVTFEHNEKCVASSSSSVSRVEAKDNLCAVLLQKFDFHRGILE